MLMYVNKNNFAQNHLLEFGEFVRRFRTLTPQEQSFWLGTLPEEQLFATGPGGFTVAEFLVGEKVFPAFLQTKRVLLIETDPNNAPLVHKLVSLGIFDEKKLTPDILCATDTNRTATAHLMARLNTLPEKYAVSEFLLLTDRYGTAVVHDYAARKPLPANLMTPEILGLRDCFGISAAHKLAAGGFLPPEYRTGTILLLEDEDGWTVAHELARKRILPTESEDILRTVNGMGGYSVLAVFLLALRKDADDGTFLSALNCFSDHTLSLMEEIAMEEIGTDDVSIFNLVRKARDSRLEMDIADELLEGKEALCPGGADGLYSCYRGS